MQGNCVALVLSVALAAAGLAAKSFLNADWAGMAYYVGVSAFVGCATNKLAIKALFDPWPSRGLALPGTGIIERRAEEIAREVARTVGQEILTPELFRAKSAETLESVVDSGVLDSEEVHLSVRNVIKERAGFVGKVGHLTGLANYDVMTHRAVDAVKDQLRQAASPSSLLSKLLERGAAALDVEKMVRERLENFGPDGLRDKAYELSRRHLVWLELWGAVFGGLVGIPAWFLAG